MGVTVVVPDDRRTMLLTSTVIGVACIVAGGLVAAITAHAPSEKASWAAAYLVLVGGVAQVGLAFGQAAYRASTSSRSAIAQVAGWNAGNALVVTGSLSDLVVLTDLGALLLVATLLLLVPSLRRPAPTMTARAKWVQHGYRGLMLLLLLSIPAGLLLARL